jgi:hypothetical protein
MLYLMKQKSGGNQNVIASTLLLYSLFTTVSDYDGLGCYHYYRSHPGYCIHLDRLQVLCKPQHYRLRYYGNVRCCNSRFGETGDSDALMPALFGALFLALNDVVQQRGDCIVNVDDNLVDPDRWVADRRERSTVGLGEQAAAMDKPEHWAQSKESIEDRLPGELFLT